MSDVSTTVSSTPLAEESPLIATFVAVISGDLERHALTIVDRALAERSRDRLLSDPGFSSWPPPGFTDAPLGEAPLEILVLARFKMGLDFRAGLDESTPQGLKRAIKAGWPKIASGRAYERVMADASLRANGDVAWGYSHGGPALALPVEAMARMKARPGGTPKDLYVQHNLRLAVLAEAATLNP